MKKIFLSLSLLLVFTNVSAQVYQWAKSINAINLDFGNTITTDALGNIYAIGRFKNTVDFDPSINTANLSSIGNWDIFIAKYDANGNYLWAKSVGSLNSDDGNSISLDVAGNIVMTGMFSGTADFDPSFNTINLTALGSSDIFIAKYDVNGNYLWAKSIGAAGASNGGNGTCIKCDLMGSAYVTGYFLGSADFDPSTNNTNHTSQGSGDIFIAKYDSNGNYMWAKTMGAAGQSLNDFGTAICIDASGNVCVTGYFQYFTDFNPSTGSPANLSSTGSSDVFIAKYDANGNYLWAKSVGGSGIEYSYSITTDASNSIYITGYFFNTADFDPSANVANLISKGSSDIFVAKYDVNGNYLWANGFGSMSPDIGYSITLDASNNVYITGDFYGKVDFDPSSIIDTLVSVGGADIFIAKYDGSGNYVWAKSTGNANTSDQGNTICLDVSGNIFVTGVFSGTVDFDFSSSTAALTSIGNVNIFIAKYSSANLPSSMKEIAKEDCFAVFPNPAKSIITIASTINGTVKINYEIVDVLGKVLMASDHTGSDKFSLNISDLNSGIYFLRLQVNNSVVVKKFVKE